ncbi:hypothetical protein [Alienimonas californiensis]|uniref:hypothetical protein n=1 Tax=Alienimonas californiensis TaxID=2527989 RepID=UPI00119EF561|nr:hypothetical protein [Alienimonas californiensis]
MSDPAAAFVAKWSASGGAETANSQSFLRDLCDLLEIPRPDPAVPEAAENRYTFERAVTRLVGGTFYGHASSMADLGRPPLPDARGKDKTFSVHETATDRQRFDAAADAAGTSASEWAREILVRVTESGGRGTRPSPDPSGGT